MCNFSHTHGESERVRVRVLNTCMSASFCWFYFDLFCFVLFYLSGCLLFICLFLLFVYLPHIRTMCGIRVNSLSPWIQWIDNALLPMHARICECRYFCGRCCRCCRCVWLYWNFQLTIKIKCYFEQTRKCTNFTHSNEEQSGDHANFCEFLARFWFFNNL